MTSWGPFNLNYPMVLSPHMQRGWCRGEAWQSVKQDYDLNQVTEGTAAITEAVTTVQSGSVVSPCWCREALAAGTQKTSP